MDLRGATALVTGTNRGIGHHFATELLARGAKVYATARRPELVAIPGVEVLRLDITDLIGQRQAAEGRTPTTVSLTATNSQQVVLAVQDGRAHLGFVEGLRAPAGVRSRSLIEDELLLVAAPGTPLARRRAPLTPAEVAALPTVARERGSGTREVVERALVHEGRKHYFLVEFPQEPGALRAFLDDVLGPDDDITLFEYVKRSNRETGPALVGIELGRPQDLAALLERMAAAPPAIERVPPDSPLFRFLL